MNLQSNTSKLNFRANDNSRYVFIRVISEEQIAKINETGELPENLTLVYSEPKIISPYSKCTNFYLANKQPFTRGVNKLPDGYKLERKFNSKTAPIVLVKVKG